MQSFISDTLDDILKTQTSFQNTVFILPSQRAGIFVKQALQQKGHLGFLPEILSIEAFIERVSGIRKIDTVPLLFYFYTVYKAQEEHPEDFYSFSSWAATLIQDFNEIDQHLISTKELFPYLRDIYRLKKWSVEKPLEQTRLMKSHFAFMEKLENYYTALYQYLFAKKSGYQGMMYREATKKIDSFCGKNKEKFFVFMGFNALNKAEEFLFQKMLAFGNTDVYWDIDEVFLAKNHQAGYFIRNYQSHWKYYETQKLKVVSNYFAEQKNIQVIGASKNTTQIKYVGEILEALPTFEDTVVVLGDESLLPIALNALPENVEHVNITMGYPLKHIPTATLFASIFQLFLTQDKLGKTTQQEFYYKDVIGFLKHRSIQQLLQVEKENLSDRITAKISRENSSFVKREDLEPLVVSLDPLSKEVLLAIFKPFSEASVFIERIRSLIALLKDRANFLEKEYLFRFFTVFTQLQNLQLEFPYLQDIKTIYPFFKQLIALEKMSFRGEPLQGLQLMGMLETRGLHFENVIISSVNEGVLPSGTSSSSFIPLDVKIAFGLPTYKEKDAIFSYHFFRLLQRSKNVFLLYNSENDTYGSGERSRFITQLLSTRESVETFQISPEIQTTKPEPVEIATSGKVLEKLKELAKKGISPSALASYLYDPLVFYKQKILDVYEYKEVEEEVAFNTMGTIVHDALETLYKPFEGCFITTKDLVRMEMDTKRVVQTCFKKHFEEALFSTGKNRLIFEVATQFIRQFIATEKKGLYDSKSLKIIAVEKKLEASITVEGLPFPVKIKGIVDRVDEYKGVTRIIDYKTGLVTSRDLQMTDVSKIREDYTYSKALQVLFYAFLYTENHPVKTPVEAGVISFKNLRGGFIKMNFSKGKTKDTLLTRERTTAAMEEIKRLLQEIYDPEQRFKSRVSI